MELKEHIEKLEALLTSEDILSEGSTLKDISSILKSAREEADKIANPEKEDEGEEDD